MPPPKCSEPYQKLRIYSLLLSASEEREERAARGVRSDTLSRSKQAPLMLAAMHGKIDCALALLHTGANILMFDSAQARTPRLNIDREKKILPKDSSKYTTPPSSSDAGAGDEEEDEEVCGICFKQACSIEVQDCGHQMCAACALALCCHSKPNPATLMLQPPSCPFCRKCISRLVVADTKGKAPAAAEALSDEKASSPRLSRRRPRRSREGSSSFKGLSSAMGSLSSKIGHRSGRLAGNSDGEFMGKLEHYP